MATAGTLVTRLNEKLNDLDAVRWPDAEHFRAIDDGLSAILEARPDLFEVYDNFSPSAGAQQSVPADCFILFDVIANLTVSGSMTSTITPIKRATLDRQRPDWPLMTANVEADHWMQDDRERKRFYVVPPQPAASQGKFLIRYSQRPSVIVSTGSVLPLENESVNALYDFCMHRALEKDEKFAGSPTAAAYMQKFATFIGARTAGEDSAKAVQQEAEA